MRDAENNPRDYGIEELFGEPYTKQAKNVYHFVAQFVFNDGRSFE